jgi:hypothetical protein
MIRVDMIHKVVIIAVGGKIGKPFLLDRQLLILERLEDPPTKIFQATHFSCTTMSAGETWGSA